MFVNRDDLETATFRFSFSSTFLSREQFQSLFLTDLHTCLTALIAAHFGCSLHYFRPFTNRFNVWVLYHFQSNANAVYLVNCYIIFMQFDGIIMKIGPNLAFVEKKKNSKINFHR
jgi:hypothetical protein